MIFFAKGTEIEYKICPNLSLSNELSFSLKMLFDCFEPLLTLKYSTEDNTDIDELNL